MGISFAAPVLHTHYAKVVAAMLWGHGSFTTPQVVGWEAFLTLVRATHWVQPQWTLEDPFAESRKRMF